VCDARCSAPLEHHGDMLLLTDIYCMYNRARGTDLVSPDDVLAACRELERLRLGMKLRRFNTGVLVVQSSNHNPDAVVARLLRLLQTRAFIDGTFVATAWKVSLPVAQEHLQVLPPLACCGACGGVVCLAVTRLTTMHGDGPGC